MNDTSEFEDISEYLNDDDPTSKSEDPSKTDDTTSKVNETEVETKIDDKDELDEDEEKLNETTDRDLPDQDDERRDELSAKNDDIETESKLKDEDTMQLEVDNEDKSNLDNETETEDKIQSESKVEEEVDNEIQDQTNDDESKTFDEKNDEDNDKIEDQEEREQHEETKEDEDKIEDQIESEEKEQILEDDNEHQEDVNKEKDQNKDEDDKPKDQDENESADKEDEEKEQTKEEDDKPKDQDENENEEKEKINEDADKEDDKVEDQIESETKEQIIEDEDGPQDQEEKEQTNEDLYIPQDQEKEQIKEDDDKIESEKDQIIKDEDKPKYPAESEEAEQIKKDNDKIEDQEKSEKITEDEDKPNDPAEDEENEQTKEKIDKNESEKKDQITEDQTEGEGKEKIDENEVKPEPHKEKEEKEHLEEENVKKNEDVQEEKDQTAENDQVKETEPEEATKSQPIDDTEAEKESETKEDDMELTKQRSDYSDFITTHIQQSDGTVKNQVIPIIKSKSRKPFIGGYRHKVTGVEYHNAAIQTLPKPRLPPNVQLFCRDTQTTEIRHQKIDTHNTTSTQMTGSHLYVANTTDKLIQPRPYETADELALKRLQNIVIIQKYYRRWLAKNLVDQKRQQLQKRTEYEEMVEQEKQHAKQNRLEFEYERRMKPKTKADFDLLYNDLEKWRQDELAKIEMQPISEAEKKTLKVILLDQETDLLARIDRHKIQLQKDGQTKHLEKLLTKAAQPRTWRDKKGKRVEMDTSYTIRSKELLDILNSLKMQFLTADERLDVLLTLKHTVKEHECKLTREIVDLVNREADLIMRNVKPESLVGLRKRLETLFSQYCKTPTFNPQISLLLRVPPDPSVLIGDINYCQYCGRYLRSTEFSLSSKSSKLNVCKQCARKDNQSRKRQDYSHYRRMLKDLQDEELEMADNSRIVFIFKQNDVRNLLESVWDSKSVLSSCDDLEELVFLRWDVTLHWSPWNTILLTKDEAEAHRKVKNLTETYSSTLVNRIYQKHVIAKNMFGSLQRMVEEIQMKSTIPTLPQIKSGN